MAIETLAVGVIAEKRKSESIWIDHTWSAFAVVPDFPEAARMTLIDRNGDGERYYIGASTVTLASAETANYRDNLTSGAAKLWVVMREQPEDGSLDLVAVTADPSEGEGFTESGSNIVDTVPMAPEIAAFVAAFVDEHHVEREFFKRKRDRLDPEKLGRRRPGQGMG